jgi:kynureninase
MGDTLSIKVFQALGACLNARPRRRVILSDSGNFPTDLYMAQGLISHLGGDYRLRVVAPEAVADSIDEDVAVLMLTHVDYRTGRMHDMGALTRQAHKAGALTLWDLAHSAGAVDLDLAGSGADFAVGCTYKYLSGGPGAPAFIYVRPDLADQVNPILAGWMGHTAPFAFEPDYRPAPGVGRLRVGTPPVVALSILDASLELWEGVDMSVLRARSVALGDRFIAGVDAEGLDLKLASPRTGAFRGSQVSYAFGQGYAVVQALIAEGVVGDFRAPDIMRFGFSPLYVSLEDIDLAVAALCRVLREGRYLRPEFQVRAAVT